MLIAWVFFRAHSVTDAWYIISNFGDFNDFKLGTLWRLGLPRFEMMIAFFSILILFVVDFIQESKPKLMLAWWEKSMIRWSLYLATVFMIIFFGSFGKVEFIYFDF